MTDQLIETPGTLHSSPSRKAKKPISYAESDDEDDVFKPLSGNGRAAKRRRVGVKDDSDDEFGFDAATQAALEDEDGMSISHYSHPEITYETTTALFQSKAHVHSHLQTQANQIKSEGMDDFVAPDDEEDTPKAKKRSSTSSWRKTSVKPPSPPREDSEEIPTTSTAQQWKFDPDAAPSEEPRRAIPAKKIASGPPKKQKAHVTDPDKRYPWLAQVLDADRNPPDHPDYDPPVSYTHLTLPTKRIV